MKESGYEVDDEFVETRISEIEQEATRQEKAGLAIWGNEFYRNNPRFFFFFTVKQKY